MGQKRCLNINKLSAAVPQAALDQAKEQLAKLRRLTAQGAEFGEELAQVVAQLRQVAAPANEPFIFTTNLAENIHLLQVVFRDCADIKYRNFSARGTKAVLVYLDGMTDSTLLEKNVLENLMAPLPAESANAVVNVDSLTQTLLTTASLTVISQAHQAIEAVMTGNALLLIDGIAEGLTIGATKHVKRQVGEAKEEGQIRTPHDAFNETLRDNIVLIRRRTRDTNLKVRIITLGERSKTAVALIYVANLVKPGLVEEVERRLGTIHIDNLMLAHTIAEVITDHPWTPFPQTLSTEKPDRVVNWLYQGRVAILTDNTVYALIVPCTYSALMTSPDDYAVPAVIASLIRFTRHVAAFVAIYMPAVYIAVVSFHPAVLPTTLAISIAELRARTPFPSFLEAMLMEALLELFQEAVVRLPAKVAGAAGVLSAFVIGTTIVEAGLVNPLLVVVTAVSGIAAYSLSSYSFGLALRALRVPLIILASILGLYGVVLGVLVVTIHLCSLRSFGESWLGGIADIPLLEDWKDTVLRLPAKFLQTRPKEIGAQERTKAGGSSNG